MAHSRGCDEYMIVEYLDPQDFGKDLVALVGSGSNKLYSKDVQGQKAQIALPEIKLRV